MLRLLTICGPTWSLTYQAGEPKEGRRGAIAYAKFFLTREHRGRKYLLKFAEKKHLLHVSTIILSRPKLNLTKSITYLFRQEGHQTFRKKLFSKQK